MTTHQLRIMRMVIWGTLPLILFAMIASLWLSIHKRAATQEIRLNYPLPNFTLTNQDDQPVSLSDLRGKVWVADIIFTRCAGPCPVMTRQLSELQEPLFKNGDVKFVTLTTDPGYDSPTMMKRFGERFSADFKNWYFLTGDKKQIADLAIDGMKLVAIEKKPEEREDPADLFIHSTRFVVVDKSGTVRASFDSTDPDTRDKVLSSVRKLLRESEKPQLSKTGH